MRRTSTTAGEPGPAAVRGQQNVLLREAEARAEADARLATILQSVVSATLALAEEADFEVGINRWLQVLGENTDAARATIYDTTGTQGSPEQTLRALAEWVRPGIDHSLAVSFSAPTLLPIDHATDFWREILDNRPFVATPDNLGEQMRQHLESQGNKAVLCLPFLVNGQSWAVSFDFLVAREFDDRTLVTLQTAANSIAAELLRRQAEAGRLAAERDRALAAEAGERALVRRRDMLEAVVEASNRLLSVATLDEAAAWTCERIGRVLDGDRALIGRFLPPDADSRLGYCFWAHEWAAPGIKRQTDDAKLQTISMDHYAEFYESLLRNEPLAVLTADIPSQQAQAEQQSVDVQSLFAYPIFVGGSLWGLIDVDDCRRPRIWDEGEVATLSLVASAIASTVQRERLTQQRIDAERALFEDRNRIARDIHDTLAQGFTGVIMQTQAAEEAMNNNDGSAVSDHLARARTIAGSSLRDARRSVFALLPSVLEGTTLAAALAGQVKMMTVGAALHIQFTESGQARTPSNLVATELIRIAQEAITNALRHADAANLRVTLEWDDEVVTLSVADDGKGFVPSLDHPGFGLVSIRERADRMGAQLAIDSKLGRGAVIRVTAMVGQSLAVGGASW